MMVFRTGWQKRRSLGVTLWIASFILGIALITGTLGGTGVRAAHDGYVYHLAPTGRALRHALPGAHSRLLQQRIGGTPMSSQ